MNLTKRTELRRIPDRGSHDWETISQILDAGFLAYVGFCVDGQPFVIPTLYGRDGERLYLHGSAVSRMLRELDMGICTFLIHVVKNDTGNSPHHIQKFEGEIWIRFKPSLEITAHSFFACDSPGRITQELCSSRRYQNNLWCVVRT